MLLYSKLAKLNLCSDTQNMSLSTRASGPRRAGHTWMEYLGQYSVPTDMQQVLCSLPVLANETMEGLADHQRVVRAVRPVDVESTVEHIPIVSG